MTDPAENPTLEEATLDQLWAEVQKRFPQGVVLAGVKPARSEGSDEFHSFYAGGQTLCIGIAHRLRSLITTEANIDLFHENDEIDGGGRDVEPDGEDG